MNAPKRKGDRFELEVAKVFAAHGIATAERALRLGAHRDDGDLAGVEGWHIDTKNHARLELSTWLDEVEREAVERVPLVVVKRKGRGPEHAYAVLTLAHMAEGIARGWR